eukprot:SAG31_NODE_1350_length_8681_cov_14.408879_3_plen_61_part_00
MDGSSVALWWGAQMSYQWNDQHTVKRIVAALKKRSYILWFDLESMVRPMQPFAEFHAKYC